LLLLAKKISRFLFRFPFVRGIGISGSLSKNCADQDSDIDFFVITRRNRLWICRTLMHLFKKLTFLTGHQHWFCMNYYIDEVALCIEEKNLFTATELVTLLPVCGKGVMESFYQANSWVQSYFPNRSEKEASSKTTGQHRFKNAVEFLFSNPAGEKLDNFLMKLTSRRWKKKEDQFRLNIKGKRMGLRTGKHFSKPNPVFFQEKILSLHSKRLREMEEKLQATPAANENQVLFLREII
jgi:predicted nucleotidyltransferase